MLKTGDKVYCKKTYSTDAKINRPFFVKGAYYTIYALFSHDKSWFCDLLYADHSTCSFTKDVFDKYFLDLNEERKRKLQKLNEKG